MAGSWVRRAIVFSSLLTLSFGPLAGRARADGPPPAAAAPPAVAPPDDPKELFDRGSALYALGRYGEAAPLFERAFELKPDPALLYNAAQAYRFNGNKQRALTLYQNYYRLYGDQIQNSDDAKRQIEQLKQAIAMDERAKVAPPTDMQTPGGTAALVVAAPVRPKPLVKRPWFWVAVGGAAAIVITGVAVGVSVGTRGHSYPAASFGSVNGN
jgi:tetratricopeptide (TPR) repeat protein